MRKIVILILIIFISNQFYAHNRAVFGDVRYTTEFQYNFQDNYNWVNLLAFNVQLSTGTIGAWRNGFFDMELISVYRTSKERILDDWQTFSNIDEKSVPLRIFTFGYTHVIGKANLFLGLRNVNRDYFTTPYTSLFTNSSCGIYPTISANYPLANYPLSAMCVHAEYEIDSRWSVKSSLYNGIAYESLKHVFSINPRRDGVFSITQINHTQNSKYYGTYSLGSTVHSRMPVCDENSDNQFEEKKVSQKETTIDCSFWTNIEQCIYSENGREIGVLAQCSFAPSSVTPCSQYYGVGLLFNGWTVNSGRDQFGVFINKSKFDNEKETSLELTWRCQITNNIEIQPALHLIENRGNVMAAGLFRMSYVLNFR